LVNIQLNLIAG